MVHIMNRIVKIVLYKYTKAYNPVYLEYDSSRSYLFYLEYDFNQGLHLARLPRRLTFWNPIG